VIQSGAGLPPSVDVGQHDRMLSARRSLYLHVGTRKSGTSFVQEAFLESRPQLAEHGLAVPLGARTSHLELALKPLLAARQDDLDSARAGLAAATERLRQAEQPRVLVTIEDLAELEEWRTELFLQEVSGEFDVHVLISARHWGKQIPSEWQQCVKERLTTPYQDYVRGIRDRDGTPHTEQFIARQHVPSIAERWGRMLEPDRVHVVAVPPSYEDPHRLLGLFSSVLEVNPDLLTAPPRPRNLSLGYQQAETLRRVNVALGQRLPDFYTQYRLAVRRDVARGTLLRQNGRPLRLPEEFVAWCMQESAAQVKELVDSGYHMVGDPDHLVFDGRQGDPPFREVTEKEIARAAVRALTTLAVRRYHELYSPEAEAVRASEVPQPRRRTPLRLARGAARRARDWLVPRLRRAR
jgi:hypothetical protein